MLPGMTIHDWFAGQIIAAMIGSDPAYSSTRDKDGRLCGIEPARLANMSKNAYQIAEAMMQARAAAGLVAPAAHVAPVAHRPVVANRPVDAHRVVDVHQAGRAPEAAK
jgi:hypothetical protein